MYAENPGKERRLSSFVIGSVSIVNGRNGEFVSMPAYKSSTKARNGENSFREIAYPITKEFREQLFGEILNVYHEKKAEKIKEAKDKAVQESRKIRHFAKFANLLK